MASRLRDWLELMRISNAPTIISNVLVGGAIAASGRTMPWIDLAITGVAMLFLYAAGMILNDLMDAAVDRIERPGRPIPSDRIRPSEALWVAIGLSVYALFTIAIACPYALPATIALVICIIAYDALHRRSAWTVLLLGACRGLVYIIAALATAHDRSLDWLWLGGCAGFMAAYVIVLSLVARSEANRPGRIRLVVAMICGISLLDAGLLMVLQQPLAAGIAVGCFIVCAFAQRRILGT